VCGGGGGGGKRGGGGGGGGGEVHKDNVWPLAGCKGWMEGKEGCRCGRGGREVGLSGEVCDTRVQRRYASGVFVLVAQDRDNMHETQKTRIHLKRMLAHIIDTLVSARPRRWKVLFNIAIQREKVGGGGGGGNQFHKTRHGEVEIGRFDIEMDHAVAVHVRQACCCVCCHL